MLHFDRRHALKLGLTSLLTGACVRGGSAITSTTGVGIAPSATASRRVVSGGPPATNFTLAFGSCNRSSLPQPLWSDVRALEPDVWAWLGDIVYADSDDASRAKYLYREQATRSDYAALVAQTQVVGIWDDHDFGRNDAGFEYPSRLESQSALLDFLGEPKDSPRRRQFGVYASYDFGVGERSVKLVMLDGRFHRDPPGRHGDTLGEDQWAWLERELTSSTARVNLIVSGYQVLPLDHRAEKWGNFPRARQRLLDLVVSSRVRGAVLLSGDRHFAELSRLEHGSLRYPLYELTSSGLTHACETILDPNGMRVGSPYLHRNFGVVKIDWERQRLGLEARGVGGNVVIERAVPLAALG